MKNPLADIIRQSGDSDYALSDSGSFDTTEGLLGSTANDEHVVSDDAIDLELLEATGALVLDNGSVRFEVTEVSPADDSVAVADTPPAASDDVERPPALSRFAPLICVAVVFFTAVAWTTYRHLQSGYVDNALGTAEPATAGEGEAVAGSVQIAGAERFPFIDPQSRQGEAE